MTVSSMATRADEVVVEVLPPPPQRSAVTAPIAMEGRGHEFSRRTILSTFFLLSSFSRPLSGSSPALLCPPLYRVYSLPPISSPLSCRLLFSHPPTCLATIVTTKRCSPSQTHDVVEEVGLDRVHDRLQHRPDPVRPQLSDPVPLTQPQAGDVCVCWALWVAGCGVMCGVLGLVCSPRCACACVCVCVCARARACVY